jgi:recombination protein RecR
VGEKSAARHALFLITTDKDAAREFGKELIACCEKLRPCSMCGHVAELPDGIDLDLADDAEIEANAICSICADASRGNGFLCVVESVQDLIAIERTGEMKGRYFVLGQLLRVQDNAEEKEVLTNRIRSRILDEANPIKEVLIAVSPSADGKATAFYLVNELADTGARITRMASGIPHGGTIEHIDMVTVGDAIRDRKVVESEE